MSSNFLNLKFFEYKLRKNNLVLKKYSKKALDIYTRFCYNVVVAWRDGRVGLRRTTGNRVYPNRYHGFESHSLRHNSSTLFLGCLNYFMAERTSLRTHCRTATWVRIPSENRVKLACKRRARVSSPCEYPFSPHPKNRAIDLFYLSIS